MKNIQTNKQNLRITSPYRIAPHRDDLVLPAAVKSVTSVFLRVKVFVDDYHFDGGVSVSVSFADVMQRVICRGKTCTTSDETRGEVASRLRVFES